VVPLETDEGARRLGELSVGMNSGIGRVTDNVLFIESTSRSSANTPVAMRRRDDRAPS
jgi:leucyl aminopeptidase (aminopeptidase T)